jgi:hypothetical protein
MDRNDPLDLATPPGLLELARQRLGTGPSIHYAPSIPPPKEQEARAAHALHLPLGEPLLVLYDGTLFGRSDDGFLITLERFCWKNLWSHPRMLAWEDLDPATVRPRIGKVELAGGTVDLSGELANGLAALLVEVASRRRAARAGPYRSDRDVQPLAPGAVLEPERLVQLARSHLGEVDDVFYLPAIPPAKLERARAAHAVHLPVGEAVAVLYDDTVFGSAEEGFLITPSRLCWKNLAEEAAHVLWSDLRPEAVAVRSGVVLVGENGPRLASHSELLGPTARLFAAIAAEAARGGRA